MSMPIWLWKYGAVRMPPFHHCVNCMRETTPGLRSRAKRCCIAVPITLTPEMTSGGIRGLTGSAKGGMNRRAGKIELLVW